ncbi:SpoIIE family protein phosphatase [Streptomyces sp. NPDC001941]|uniref:SpoIIE family protein phosphatase n=1 Tax=Streptomyces sp. NPDC001941 TaxID=3154659 RepID=UPI00331B2AC5
MAVEDERAELAAGVLTEQQARAVLAWIEALPADARPDGLEPLVRDYRTVRQVLDRADIGMAVLDAGYRFRYVNDALAALNGRTVAEHLGRRVGEVVPDINVEDIEQVLSAVLRDGRPRALTVSGTTHSDHPGGPRWWHNAYHRLTSPDGEPVGVAALILEITSDRVIRKTLDRARRRLALLDKAATRIGTTLDVQRTCEELTQVLVPQLADVAVVDVVEFERLPPPPGPLRMRRLALSATRGLQRIGHYVGTPGALIEVQAESAAARCLDEQRAVVLNRPEEPAQQRLYVNDVRAGIYRRLGLHSGCYVPLSAGHDIVGVVGLARADDDAPFSEEDVALVSEVVRRAASSIDAAQRYTRQRDTAVVLQRALLSSRTVPHADVECASRYLPSGSGAEVGGDWYDTIGLPGGTTVLVVGDVMGHGLDAAATMAEYRATLRTLVFEGLAPDQVLTRADAVAQTLDLERLATCLVAAVDPVAGTATMASAGHLPPLLVEQGARGRLVAEVSVGPPLGAGFEPYEPVTVALPPGAALLLYTDGLVERRDEDIDQALAELGALPLDPAEPLDRLLDAVLSRLAAAPAEDDVALLAARIRKG